ncbi:hypothetical protein LGN06_07960 [Burkholderia vietnamiensis]|nr:hypothetical protein [Burkholderia vietnamiensis]
MIAAVPSPSSTPCAVNVVLPVPPPATEAVPKDGSAVAPFDTRGTPVVALGEAKLTGLDPSPISTAFALRAFRPVPPLVAPIGEDVVTVTPVMLPPVTLTAFAF